MKNKLTLVGFIIFISFSFTMSNKKDLKWKFEKFKKLTFRYEQTMTNKSSFSFGGKEKMEMVNKAEGLLIVKVKNDNFADIILKDIQMSMLRVDSLGDTSTMMSQNMPEMFIQDLKEDGTIEGQLNQQTDMLAKTLFPIINKPVGVGESVDLPLVVPFNIYGSVINVKGYNRIKYAGVENGLDKLESVINVSEYTLPDEVKTKYICYMKGNSTYNFNSEKGYFTDGYVKINMVMGTEPSKKADTTQSDFFKNLSMNMDSVVKLKLIKVE